MIDNENTNENVKNNFAPPLKIKMRLNTVKNSRASMARIMRLYAAGEIDHTTFRNMIYAYSHFIQYLKLEKEQDIETRLDDIENKVYEAKFAIIGVDADRGEACEA